MFFITQVFHPTISEEGEVWEEEEVDRPTGGKSTVTLLCVT